MEQYFTTKEQSMLLEDLGIKGKTIMAWSYAGSKEEKTISDYAYQERLICVHGGRTSGTEWGLRAEYGHGIIAPAFMMAQLYNGFSSIQSRVFVNELIVSPDNVRMEQVVQFLVETLDTQQAVEDFNSRMRTIR